MTTRPPIAICIGCFNQGHYLEGAIQSALAQTYPNIEIWVSDDCSTDTTPLVIAQLRAKWPGIKFFRQEKNLGVAGNNSWLLAQPKTELVVRLDSDDRLERKYVEVLSSLMDKYPRAGFAHCHAYELDGEGNKTRILRIRPRPEYHDSETALRDTAPGMRVAANNIMYRVEAIRQANYFKLGMRYSEDWDLLVKLADLHWGNVYSPRILSNYRAWADANNFRARRKAAEVSTTIQVYEETLAPAYSRRGWDTEILKRYRKRKAIILSDALDSPLFTREEREEYKRLLIRLGDCLGLRLRLLLFHLGATPLLRKQRKLIVRLKDIVKNLLDARRESTGDYST
jgi:glycosyltransferase involved in cell wall biosynthesis